MVNKKKVRLTEEQIKSMKKLHKSGSTYSEISIELKIKYPTVLYHLDENYRRNTIERVTRNRKKKKNGNKRKYNRDYQRERYANDPEFREKRIEQSKKTREKSKKC